MFTFKGYLERVELDKGNLTKKLQAAFQREIRNAAREFLRAAILKVPTYTGMARGMLMPLQRYLNQRMGDIGSSLVTLDINPVVGAQKKHPGMNPEAGASFGQDFTFNKGGQYRFSINVQLAHFLINDFYSQAGTDTVSESGNLTHPIPWGAIEAGREAFKKYLRDNLANNLPKIAKFISHTRVNF